MLNESFMLLGFFLCKVSVRSVNVQEIPVNRKLKFQTAVMYLRWLFNAWLYLSSWVL